MINENPNYGNTIKVDDSYIDENTSISVYTTNLQKGMYNILLII